MTAKVFAAGLVALLAFGCSDPPTTPTALGDEAVAPAFTVDVLEYTWDLDLGADPPVKDWCGAGEDMQYHGVLLVHVREKTAPSGNLVVSGWVDYDAYGEVTAEGLSSGDIWTLTNGHNPWSEVSKENGFYTLAFHWNELFKNPDGQTLHILHKGHVKIDPAGNVTIDRESHTCR